MVVAVGQTCCGHLRVMLGVYESVTSLLTNDTDIEVCF